MSKSLTGRWHVRANAEDELVLTVEEVEAYESGSYYERTPKSRDATPADLVELGRMGVFNVGGKP